MCLMASTVLPTYMEVETLIQCYLNKSKPSLSYQSFSTFMSLHGKVRPTGQRCASCFITSSYFAKLTYNERDVDTGFRGL